MVKRKCHVLATMPHATVNPTIVRAVTCYLMANPLASDTSQGITQWWLLDQRNLPEADVLTALEWLQRWQLLERIVASDGRVRFRRDAAMSNEVWRQRLQVALQSLPPIS